MEIKDLLDKDGWEFEAMLDGKYAVGKITIEDNKVFLCQNVFDGDSCGDRKGFKYSYSVVQGHLDGKYTFSNFKLINSAQEAIKNNNWYIRGSEEFAEFLKLGFIDNPYNLIGNQKESCYYRDKMLKCPTPLQMSTKNKTLVTVQDLKNYYMKDRKIEYYELLKDLPNVSKGSMFWYDTGQKNWECCINNVTYSDEVIKASTEWFKPHYKNVVPQIGEYKLEKEGGDIWKFGCTEFDAEYLLTLYSSSKELFITKNELSFNISGHTISMQKLEEIVNYIKSNS